MSHDLLAATWKFTPGISLTETYYDNITLSATSKNKELVSQLTPTMSLAATGKRLELSSRYSLGYINYWGSEFSDRYTNQGSLSGNLELIKNHLFVKTSANVSEQSIDPTKVSAVNAQTVTDNRTKTRSLMINPVLRNRFGRYAESLLSYSYSRIAHSSSQINSSYNNSVNYSLSSGKWFKRLSWLGNASIRNGQQNNANNYKADGRMDYVTSKRWKIFAVGLAQKNNFINNRTNNNLTSNTGRYFIKSEAGVVWTASRKVLVEVGGGAVFNASALSQKNIEIDQLTWRAKLVLNPTSRTSFELGREQASFGRKVYATFDHYTRRTTWASTYSETLATPQQARNLSISNNVAAVGNLGNTNSFSELDRQVTNDVILRKRLEFDGSIRRRKVNLKGSAFYEKGEYQTSSQKDKRYGANGGLSINLTRKLSGSANSSLQRYNFIAHNRIDNIYSISTALTRLLGKKANMSLTYIWQKRSTSSGVVNYTSNQILAKVGMTF